MEDLAEFKALEDDEARRQAFQKFLKRQKVRGTVFRFPIVTHCFTGEAS